MILGKPPKSVKDYTLMPRPELSGDGGLLTRRRTVPADLVLQRRPASRSGGNHGGSECLYRLRRDGRDGPARSLPDLFALFLSGLLREIIRTAVLLRRVRANLFLRGE